MQKDAEVLQEILAKTPKPKKKSIKWTEEDQHQLYGALQKYGILRVDLVVQCFPTKSPKQVVKQIFGLVQRANQKIQAAQQRNEEFVLDVMTTNLHDENIICAQLKSLLSRIITPENMKVVGNLTPQQREKCQQVIQNIIEIKDDVPLLIATQIGSLINQVSFTQLYAYVCDQQWVKQY